MSTQQNLLDFQDPGTMSEELLSVPGFVNKLKDYTLAVSPRPNPPLAFAGALAMLTHLTGRSYVDERGSHTNLYLAALAPTAMGKDELFPSILHDGSLPRKTFSMGEADSKRFYLEARRIRP